MLAVYLRPSKTLQGAVLRGHNTFGCSELSSAGTTLSKRQLQFLDALVVRIKAAGLRVLPESKGSDQLHQRYKTVLDSQGVLAVVFGQWERRR